MFKVCNDITPAQIIRSFLNEKNPTKYHHKNSSVYSVLGVICPWRASNTAQIYAVSTGATRQTFLRQGKYVKVKVQKHMKSCIKCT